MLDYVAIYHYHALQYVSRDLHADRERVMEKLAHNPNNQALLDEKERIESTISDLNKVISYFV